MPSANRGIGRGGKERQDLARIELEEMLDHDIILAASLASVQIWLAVSVNSLRLIVNNLPASEIMYAKRTSDGPAIEPCSDRSCGDVVGGRHVWDGSR